MVCGGGGGGRKRGERERRKLWDQYEPLGKYYMNSLFSSFPMSTQCPQSANWFIGCPQIQQKWYTYNLLSPFSRDLRRGEWNERGDDFIVHTLVNIIWWVVWPYFFSDCSWDWCPKSFRPRTRGDLFFCTDLFTKRERKNGEPADLASFKNNHTVVDIQFSLWRGRGSFTSSHLEDLPDRHRRILCDP